MNVIDSMTLEMIYVSDVVNTYSAGARGLVYEDGSSGASHLRLMILDS